MKKLLFLLIIVLGFISCKKKEDDKSNPAFLYTDRWAVKVSYVEIDGKAIDIRKTPKTDMTKASKAGILKLHKSGGKFMTIESSKEQFGVNNGYTDELELVFENGVLYRDQTFEEIRQIANSYL